MASKAFVYEPIHILKKISRQNDDGLKASLAEKALQHWKVPAKPLQIESVSHLVRGQDTLILAGTGFGKSRIPELYYKLLVPTALGVILVLNPIDLLGDNQVLEKKCGGFSAINLTKLSFNDTEAEITTLST
jgi:superfamily II DNA helicase RecQ